MVSEYWQRLLREDETQFLERIFKKFTTYIYNNYASITTGFKTSMWNHSTVGPRTNNNVEGYNLRLKKFFNCASPDIFKTIEKFREEEVNTMLKHTTMVKDPKYKPPQPKQYYAIKESNFLLLKDLYSSNQLTLDVYYTRVLQTYEFQPRIHAEDSESESECSDDDESDGEDRPPITTNATTTAVTTATTTATIATTTAATATIATANDSQQELPDLSLNEDNEFVFDDYERLLNDETVSEFLRGLRETNEYGLLDL